MKVLTHMAGLAAAGLLAGCGWAREEPDAPPGVAPEPPSRPGERVADTAVVALVKSAPLADGGGTMALWLDREMKAITGQVMFPRWEVDRRGASKYEVRFTFTLIDAENRIVKRGYAWAVDAGLQMVGPPRVLTPEFVPEFNRSDTTGEEYKRAKALQAELE